MSRARYLPRILRPITHRHPPRLQCCIHRSQRVLPTLRHPLFRSLTTSSNPHASVSAQSLRVDHAEDIGNQTVAAMGRTTTGKALKIRKYPTFEKLEDERLYRKQHLAAAYRIFAQRGFDEGVAGHISVRDPILTDHFCTSEISQDIARVEAKKFIL